MSTSRAYHHGDLRAVLLDAAERMIDADVGRQFSLRELAREAGVSHAAPYKHFADRGALVEALATRWMTDFVRCQEVAVAGVDARADVIQAGEAYLGWAVDHPSRFALIFDPALNHGPDADGELAPIVARHVELLGRLVAAAGEAGALRGAPEDAAVRLWATVHGLAVLVNLGLLTRSTAVATVRGSLD